jgi:hypothetical protein
MRRAQESALRRQGDAVTSQFDGWAGVERVFRDGPCNELGSSLSAVRALTSTS